MASKYKSREWANIYTGHLQRPPVTAARLNEIIGAAGLPTETIKGFIGDLGYASLAQMPPADYKRLAGMIEGHLRVLAQIEAIDKLIDFANGGGK